MLEKSTAIGFERVLETANAEITTHLEPTQQGDATGIALILVHPKGFEPLAF